MNLNRIQLPQAEEAGMSGRFLAVIYSLPTLFYPLLFLFINSAVVEIIPAITAKTAMPAKPKLIKRADQGRVS